MLTLNSWLRQCLSGYSAKKWLFFSLVFNNVPFEKKWGVMFHLFDDRVSTSIICISSVWEIVPIIYLFIQSFISVWIYEYLFYILE